MTKGHIQKGVKKIFIELFPELKRERFNFNKKQSDFEDWDSFMHMKLASMMEETFSVKLAVEKIIDVDSPIKFVEIIHEALSDHRPAEGRGDNPLEGLKNFSEILDFWAINMPDKTFITSISSATSYSYSNFNRLVNSCSRFLKKRGVEKGDIVLVCVRNSVEFLVIYFAAMRVGGIINLVPSSVAEKELFANISYLKPGLAFIEKKYSKGAPKKKGLFTVEFEGTSAFLDILNTFPDDTVPTDIKENDPACLYYSSGTTANPKGILFSHKGIVNVAKLLCGAFNHNEESIHLGILPMGHTSVMHHSLLPMVYMGGTFVFSENFISIRKDFWRIIEAHNINYVQTVPTVIFSILNTTYPDYKKKKLALKFIACGSAPLPEVLKHRFEKKFGLRIANLYGLSEASHMIDDYPFEETWQAGSLGRPIEGIEVKIFDNAGKEVKTGTIGEFVVQSPSLFMAYYKDKKLYKASFKKGYFCTGDLGYTDKKGLFYYSGRKKDLIIKGGVNISPNLVDEVLLKHPKIADAASLGKADDFFGEVIKSFVVVKSGKKMSEKEFFAYSKNKLGRFKSPSEVEFVETIPKTFSGKILRRNLRQK